jgi:hypothetical protein
LSIRVGASAATASLAVLTVTEADCGGANPRTLSIGDSANVAVSAP